MKKVCVIYLMTGIGHYRASLAIKKYFDEKNVQTEMIDFFDIIDIKSKVIIKSIIFLGFIGNLISSGLSINKHKGAYVALNNFHSFLRIASPHFKIKSKLDEFDKIISTHPISSRIISHSSKFELEKLINVIPDECSDLAAQFYTVPNITNCVVSQATNDICKKVCPNTHIRIVGYPLDPKILNSLKTINKRVRHDFASNSLKLGLYIGQFQPLFQITGIIKTLIKFRNIPNIKMFLMDGNNILLKVFTKFFTPFTKNLMYFHTPKPIDQIVIGHHWIINDINILQSRPSELVFYSLATHIPHVVYKTLGEQEVDLLNFLKSKGSGINLNKFLESPSVTNLRSCHKKILTTNYNFEGCKNIYKLLKI